MANYSFSNEDAQKNKGTGILISIFVFLFFLPLVSADMKSSEYLKFRANNSLIIFIGSLCGTIISKIPIIGFVGSILGFLVGILAIINIVYACQASNKELPFVGSIQILK